MGKVHDPNYMQVTMTVVGLKEVFAFLQPKCVDQDANQSKKKNYIIQLSL